MTEDINPGEIQALPLNLTRRIHRIPQNQLYPTTILEGSTTHGSSVGTTQYPNEIDKEFRTLVMKYDRTYRKEKDQQKKANVEQLLKFYGIVNPGGQFGLDSLPNGMLLRASHHILYDSYGAIAVTPTNDGLRTIANALEESNAAWDAAIADWWPNPATAEEYRTVLQNCLMRPFFSRKSIAEVQWTILILLPEAACPEGYPINIPVGDATSAGVTSWEPYALPSLRPSAPSLSIPEPEHYSYRYHNPDYLDVANVSAIFVPYCGVPQHL
ncbi:hypothetical protein MPER_09904 [Moniliophthora perniciosa FA553]|nr:hypothetical protein MPER_09904 [Moniliophthora perniciosa FA553]